MGMGMGVRFFARVCLRMRELGAESGQERVLGIKLDREKITKGGRERVKREREIEKLLFE